MNPTLKTLHDLRSIHGSFSAQDISDTDLQTILEASVRAATASALQSYSILVIRDRETILREFDYPASKALLFCVDYNRLTDCATALGKEMRETGIISFITGATDTLLAAQNAAVAAKCLGVDSLFTNSIHRHDLNRVYDAFNLPSTLCFPLITLLLGYPSCEPDHKKGRIMKGVIHEGLYQRLSKEEISAMIDMYDDKNLGLSQIYDWKEKGYPHYLDWLFTEWIDGYPKACTDSFREKLTAIGLL